MKYISLLIIFFLFNSCISSNLFFQWRITDLEKAQFREEVFSLFQSNSDLYQKIVSNYNQKYNHLYKSKNTKSSTEKEEEEEEPNLYLSRYTYCQKCMTFLQSFRHIKEKYGFQNFYNNLKTVACLLTESFGVLASDACMNLIDGYGPIIVENIFTRYVNSYFLCEKIDLCPTEIPKKFIDPDKYAENIVKGKPNKQKEKIQENGEKLKVLQLTDIHLDLEYAKNSPAKCKYPLCCRNYTNSEIRDGDPLCGKYGYEGKSDIGIELFDSFIEDISNKDIDFIIWTGDNAPHDVWSDNQELVYYTSGLIRDKLNEKFRNKDKKIPIFYCLGNHEKYPNDAYHDDETNLLKNYGEIYKEYLTDEAYNDFRKYGYYSMKYDSNLRIIAINCFLCDSFNFNLVNSTKKHSKEMFDWLEKELKKAEDNNEYVYILNHFPLNGEFTWAECGKRFQALFDRYEYNVRGIFSGHTHRDDIEGITEYFNKNKTIHLNFVAPQLTTYDKKLPSYRIYTIDKETKQVIDYEQFRFNLTKSNDEEKPYWYTSYIASEFYGVKNMLEYNNIINFDKMDEYVFHQLSDAKIGENNRNNPDRHKSAKCIMTTSNFYEYFQCYSPAFALKYEFLALFTNFLIGPMEE